MIQKEIDNSEIRPETSNTSDHHHLNDASKSVLLKPSSTSATPSWSRFKDPRVVRASKALGGKDRHSKVCTVRGLRDRRVRLSVPTAIQLYDLQERLGLNQPSKAVDWLLNAAKNEIDELPPLQIPSGMNILGENYNNDDNSLQPIQNFLEFRSDKQDLIKIGSSEFYRGKSNDGDDDNWARNQEERQFHQLENNSNTNNNNQALLSNSTYNPIFILDPSDLSPRMTAHHEDWRNFGLLPVQPTLSTVPSGSHPHQVVVYHQPEMSKQSYFPSTGEFDLKQANFQSSQLTVDSTSQPVIHSSMTANLLHSQHSWNQRV